MIKDNTNEWYQVYLMASSLVFFVSFLRGMISLSIVAILPRVNALLIVLFLLSPIVISLILGRYLKFNYSSLIAIIWILGIVLSILQTDMIFRFCLLTLGLGLATTEIGKYLRMKGMNYRQVIVWFISADFVLRLLNYGQEPLINITGSGYKTIILGIIIILGMGSLYMQYQHAQIIQINDRSTLREIAVFLLLFIYIFLIGNPHILVWNTGLSLELSLLVGTVLMMGSIVLSSIFERINRRVAIVSVLLLVQTVIFHPWDNISVFFLILSPLSFILIFSYLLGDKTDADKSGINYSLFGYLILVVLIYVLLIYELYLLFPLIGFSLLIFVLNNKHDPEIRIDLSFKRYRIVYVTLLISILFLPMIYQAVPAENIAQPNLRVMSYNIHYGTDFEGFDAVDRLVEFIELNEPSVIAFQEMTVVTPLNGFGNVYGKLIRELGRFGFSNYVISSGDQYSLVNAVFSLYPIVSSTTIEIVPVVEYQRTAIVANIEVGGKIVSVVSTHLTNVGSSNGTVERVLQVENLLDQLQALPSLSNNQILAGDFNTRPTSDEYQILTSNYIDSWISWTNSSDGYTAPSDDPNKRIDYIFYSNMQLFSFELIQTTISDHLPLICDFNGTISNKPS